MTRWRQVAENAKRAVEDLDDALNLLGDGGTRPGGMLRTARQLADEATRIADAEWRKEATE